MLFKASAPGSMMLFGEYAVLHDKPALACAIDKRVEVTLTPREDDLIRIDSDRMGQMQVFLSDLSVERPFQFILAAIMQVRSRLKSGFDLKITSDFSHQVGFGSSAAVTVATLAVLIQWLNIRLGQLDFIRVGRQVVRDVQGSGSGTDIAASVTGGVVLFQTQPFSVEKFAVTLPLLAFYTGFKTPTPEAIQRVQQRFAPYPHLYRHLTQCIAQCVMDAAAAIRQHDFRRLGELMTIHQGFHEALGVSMPVIHHLIDALIIQPTVMGVKISGSGLGDCVVALGRLDRELNLQALGPSVSKLSVQVSMEGVQCEKI